MVKYSRHNSDRVDILSRAPISPRVLSEMQVSKNTNLETSTTFSYSQISFRGCSEMIIVTENEDGVWV